MDSKRKKEDLSPERKKTYEEGELLEDMMMNHAGWKVFLSHVASEIRDVDRAWTSAPPEEVVRLQERKKTLEELKQWVTDKVTEKNEIANKLKISDGGIK